MKKALSILTKFYGWFINFYPRTFREEFGEEMLLDFKDTLDSASKKGIFSLSIVLLRELRDIPINLIRTYMEDGYMLKIFRSPAVNTGLRSALGFGAAFALSSIVSGLLFLAMGVSDDSVIGRLQVFYFDFFNQDSGLLFNWIFFSVICSGLTGLILGVLFAILFAEHSKYPRYILVGMLGWVLHDAVNSILVYFFNLPVFLSDWQYLYFTIMVSALSGSFLGLIFIVAKSERQEPVRLLVAGAFAYPLITYLYVKELFNIFIFTTPWRFASLVILMVVLVGGVLVVFQKSESNRKTIWIVIAGAVGYPVMSNLVYFIAQLIPQSILTWGMHPDEPYFWLTLAASQAGYGILFGLFVGLVLGFQKKNNPPQFA